MLRKLIQFVLVLACAGLVHAQTQIDQFQVLQLGYQFASPTNPSAKTAYLYIDSTGTLVCKKPDGTSCLSGGGGGAVTSVFGRTGDVVATSGDYSVGQVTGAAPLSNPSFTASTAFKINLLSPNQAALWVENATGSADITYQLQDKAGDSPIITGFDEVVTPKTADCFGNSASTFSLSQKRLSTQTGASSWSFCSDDNGNYTLTPSNADNSQKIATTAFVQSAVSGACPTCVVASSPGVGIAHFAGSTQTVTSSAIVAADITSGTITGTQIASSVALAGSPTTTTQSAGDNSTKIATTAYVDAAAPAGAPTYSRASTPAAPTLATVGSAGSTHITYAVVGCQDTACTLHTAASATTQITTANGTLTSSNYVTLKSYAVHLDGAQCYNIYRTATNGTSPTTTGKIASCVGQEYSDQGAAGDSSTAPVTNTTILVSNPFVFPGCSIAVGGLTNVDAPPCSPFELDDEFEETSITLDPRWAWQNQNSATVTQSNGLLELTSPGRSAADNLNCYYIVPPNASTTPYFFWTKVHYNNIVGGVNGNAGGGVVGTGIALSDGTKITVVGSIITTGTNGNRVGVGKWTNSTTVSTAAAIGANGTIGYVSYYAVQDDGTNVAYYSSNDGILWIKQFSETRGTFFSTAPNRVGLCIDNDTLVNEISFDFIRQASALP